MVKKHYDSPLRREQAAGTRQRIADAARGLFHEKGYAACSIGLIARTAGVSEPTVYRVFGSKRAILADLLQQMSASVRTTDAAERLASASGPHEQLAVEVDHMVSTFDEWIDFARVILNVGASDPEVAAVGREGDRRRRERQEPMLREWQRSGSLLAGLSLERAADVLCAMTGPEMFDLMTRTTGWAPDQLRQWLTGLLGRELLEQPHGGQSHVEGPPPHG